MIYELLLYNHVNIHHRYICSPGFAVISNKWSQSYIIFCACFLHHNHVYYRVSVNWGSWGASHLAIGCLFGPKDNLLSCLMLLPKLGGTSGGELRRRTSMPEVVGSIPAQVRSHSNTLRQGMNPWLLPDCTERGSTGAQNVQHLEICWRFNGVLSPGGNVRIVKSCEWLPQQVQDYKPIPLPLP